MIILTQGSTSPAATTRVLRNRWKGGDKTVINKIIMLLLAMISLIIASKL